MSNENGNDKNQSGIRGKVTPPPKPEPLRTIHEKFAKITTPPPKPPTKKSK